MALPTIKFNSSTGSDTAASGAGPSTALFGTGASLDGTVDVDLSADTPNLSGLTGDGSEVLWVDTTSGRQYSKIIGIDDLADIITCESAFTAIESGRNWGIGGKRATLDHADSRTLWNDILTGWAVSIETDQTITSALSRTAAQLTLVESIVISGSSESPRPIITQSGSGAYLFACTGATTGFGGFTWKDLQFKHSHATNQYVLGARNSRPYRFINCIIGDQSGGSNPKGVFSRDDSSPSMIMYDCDIRYCTGIGIGTSINATSSIFLIGCIVRNTTGKGIQTAGFILIEDSLIISGSDDGVYRSAGSSATTIIRNSIIHGNSGDGVDLVSGGDINFLTEIIGNNITANGGYGIRPNSEANPIIKFNNFGTGSTANTSGSINGTTPDSTNQSVDPQYTNTATLDFSVGTNVKALGFPDASRYIGANQSLTKSYVDIGAAQRQESATGAGGTTIIRNISAINTGGRL